ncbi:Mur ligase domain-containing protein, partial [Aestuariivirga sp.]|uniref:Mur ligase domain-containing protein n=1 Tax=Aestuariivirga sp. TaxID=2650926 RepID=UPI003784B9F9
MKREGFIHLVGIGGDGMLAIAQYLADQGKRFSGSDLRSSAELSSLAAKGIDVFDEHRAANVSNAELLVLSDAVPLSSPEVIEARIRDVPIMRRAEYIEHLTRDRQRIYVAGSHGKTSTSAMIATVLQHAGRSPGFILGASVPCLGNRRGRASSAGPTVIEACEAFNNLATLQPDHAVLTNVDNDHLEHYGSQEWLDKAFRKFLGRASNVPIVNGDDSGVRRILAHEG